MSELVVSPTGNLLRPSVAQATVDVDTLRRWLNDGDEIALLDVREHGLYGEGHPFFAVHAAYSRLELDVPRLVPRFGVRTVLLDDGGDDDVAARAARRLAALGYTAVHVLAGGAAAWGAAGHVLFKGVNLPSKTFGEQLEHAFDVPRIAAPALAERLKRGDRLLLLDGRTLEEHRKMTIPGALPVPNGELALRWPALVPDDQTTIVVHCAGRTRSIVGAQILRDLGVPNPVLALENGTQGWALAGLELERGSVRTLPAAPGEDDAQRDAARAASAAAARRAGVPRLTVAQAQAWLDDASRTTYVFDVRTAEEFATGSLTGARWAAGGQLLQAADLQIGVRGAHVLLLDDDDIRAPVIAAWLRRQGHDAATVDGGIHAALQVPRQAVTLPPPPRRRSTAELDAATLRFDLRPSTAYRRSHAVGAAWSIRPRLVADAQAAGGAHQAVLLITDDEAVASLAALDLREAGWSDVGWATAADVEAAGWPQQSTPQQPPDADAIDHLFFVHDRHDGNLDAARRYLAWETGLIAQCTADELGVFRLPHIDSTKASL